MSSHAASADAALPVGGPLGLRWRMIDGSVTVDLPDGVPADDTYTLVACGDHWDNHVFVGLRSRAEPERRFYAHYGIGARHICAYSTVWHRGADHDLFTVAMRRQPPGTTFDTLVEQIKAKMHEWLDANPHMPLPTRWRSAPFTAARDRSHLDEGYNLMHHNCRSFAIWLLNQFGAAQDALTDAFYDAGIAWGIPGFCGVLDAVHEMDALGALVFRYPDGITLTAIEPTTPLRTRATQP